MKKEINIYDLHAKAFPTVAAYVVTDKTGDRVATIAFKYPRDGAARLWCYLHIVGKPMARGHADGYGYDKASAAIANAARKVETYSKEEIESHWAKHAETRDSIVSAVSPDSGFHWDQKLRAAGFNVFQAV